MEVIMTQCRNNYGSYVEFKVKGGEFIGEVDRSDKSYKVFFNRDLIAVRSNKDAAIGQLQRRIKDVYGEDVKFRWNVMTYKYTLV